MMNIRIFETAYDLDDCVHFANVAQKLIAQAFTGACAFDQTGNIDKLDRGRNDFLGAREFGKHLKTLIRHRDHAKIRINRAERIIRGWRFAGPSDRVKESRFADIWQPNDSSTQHRRAP